MEVNQRVLELVPAAAIPTTRERSAMRSELELESAEPVPDFEALFVRLAPYVARVVMRLMGNDAEIDDIVQDCFFILSQRLDDVPTYGHARAFLTEVAVRRARRRLRWLAVRRRFGFEVSVESLELPMPGANPEEHALLVSLYRTLDTLPVNDRLAWSLRYLEGDTLETVAERCECSLATAKRRIAAAKRRIEEVYGDTEA